MTEHATTTPWGELPDGDPHAAHTPLVVPWLLTCLPLPVVFAASSFGRRELVMTMGLLGLTAVVGRARPVLLPAAAVVTTILLLLVTDPGLGWRLGVVAVIPLCFWMVATGASDPPFRWMPEARLFRPCLVPIGLSSLLLLRGDGNLRASAAAVALALLTAIATVVLADHVRQLLDHLAAHSQPILRAARGLERALGSVGHAIGRLLGTIIMVPITAVVIVRWATQRLVHDDPLVDRNVSPGNWVRRSGEDPEPHRMFSSAATFGSTDGRWMLRRTASTALSIGVVLVLLVTFIPDLHHAADVAQANARHVPVPRPCDPAVDPAFEHDPGYPQVLCDTADYSVRGRFSAVTTYRIADFSSETVNVKNGIRTTWHPPACDCRRIRIWLFGGSAAFGWYQRDDLDLASQIARRAWASGIALDIEVRAAPGWVIGQEQRLFEQLTVSGKRLPDLALFYDGGNDLMRQRYRDDVGNGADESETSYAEEDIDRLLRNGPFPWYADEALEATPANGTKHLSPEVLANHAMVRYRRDAELVRRAAAAAGIPVILAWQPLLVTSGRASSQKGALPPAEWRFFTRMVSAARPSIPSDVVNLSDALAGIDHPVFKDLFHHNIEAATIIADALFERIEPTLQSIAKTHGP